MAEQSTSPQIVIHHEKEERETIGRMVRRASSGDEPAKGILKKRGRVITPEERAKRMSSGIQWDEMNIIATEHPPDKDYGHMKIEEPKTPYHELVDDDDDQQNEEETAVSAKDITEQVLKTGTEYKSKWENDDNDDEMMTDDSKEKQEGFKEWRKAHYNEFAAVQRARELMKEDEEELRRLEEEEEQRENQSSQVEEMEHQ